MAYDDNPYIDFLKEDLNIEVVYDWVASSTDYEEKMNLCIGSNNSSGTDERKCNTVQSAFEI